MDRIKAMLGSDLLVDEGRTKVEFSNNVLSPVEVEFPVNPPYRNRVVKLKLTPKELTELACVAKLVEVRIQGLALNDKTVARCKCSDVVSLQKEGR